MHNYTRIHAFTFYHKIIQNHLLYYLKKKNSFQQKVSTEDPEWGEAKLYLGLIDLGCETDFTLEKYI